MIFSQRLSIGKEFEEKVSTFLTSQGFPIGLHFSAGGQWEFGESAAHLEIKLDQKFKQTGNLFIETKERRNVIGSQWRAAGIYDEHDPWFYLIGDYSTLWLLNNRWLRLMHVSGKYAAKSTDTSEGFVVSLALIEKIYIKKWTDWTQMSTNGATL